MDPTTRLPQSFFAREALAVARDLCGRDVRHGGVVLRITEVEAYRWRDDSANHCFRGRTPRNAPMFGPPGRAYVYRCYGVHWMLNLVTDAVDRGAAVLIRAAEPVAGLAEIEARRNGKTGPTSLAGPGKVAAALGLDGTFNHHPVFEAGGLEVLAGEPPDAVRLGPRVGIDYAAPEHVAAPWRIASAGTRWISVPKSLGAPEVR